MASGVSYAVVFSSMLCATVFVLSSLFANDQEYRKQMVQMFLKVLAKTNQKLKQCLATLPYIFFECSYTLRRPAFSVSSRQLTIFLVNLYSLAETNGI
jgi:hypothetical protein